MLLQILIVIWVAGGISADNEFTKRDLLGNTSAPHISVNTTGANGIDWISPTRSQRAAAAKITTIADGSATSGSLQSDHSSTSKRRDRGGNGGYRGALASASRGTSTSTSHSYNGRRSAEGLGYPELPDAAREIPVRCSNANQRDRQEPMDQGACKAYCNQRRRGHSRKRRLQCGGVYQLLKRCPPTAAQRNCRPRDDFKQRRGKRGASSSVMNRDLVRDWLAAQNISLSSNESLILNASMLARLIDSSILSAMRAWLEISKYLWWCVASIAFLSVLLYTYACLELVLKHNWRKHVLLLVISCVDCFMLFAVGMILIAQRFWPHGRPAGAAMCKAKLFIGNTAGLFTNWTWFLLWAQRYVAVFHPMWRYKLNYRSHWFPLFLMFGSVICECWTLVLSTEHNVAGIRFCDLDTRIADYGLVKWLTLVEAIVSWFVPFLFIISANMMIVCRSYASSMIVQFSRDQLNKLGGAKSTRSVPEAAKILPKGYRSQSRKCRHRLLLRTLISATIDLVMNLPAYSFQLVDNFMHLHQLVPNSWWRYGLEGAAYMLYFCQFPLIIVYIRILVHQQQTGSAANQATPKANFRDLAFRKRSFTVPGRLGVVNTNTGSGHSSRLAVLMADKQPLHSAASYYSVSYQAPLKNPLGKYLQAKAKERLV